MAMQTLTAVVHKEDDLYIAERPEVGTVSQGETVEEAVDNLKEATGTLSGRISRSAVSIRFADPILCYPYER